MDKILKSLYLNAPFFVKRAFANIEAIRRNLYRRSGQYYLHFNNLNMSNMLLKYNSNNQIDMMNNLLNYVELNIPFYQENLKLSSIKSLKEIEEIPMSSKWLMRENIDKFINKDMEKKLWNGKSSGSTGTPFSYYRDKNSVQYEYALYDKLYDYLSNTQNGRKARISGVSIVKADYLKPPFWYFIKIFNQLQISAYHIDANTYKFYLKALKEYKINLGTGYASSWLFLAQYMQNDQWDIPDLRVIVTDSEGFSEMDKRKIENAFKCSVYQTYGLGEVGMIAIQCKSNHYHSFSERCYIEVVDENGKRTKDGEEGEIVVTDLHSFNAPFIRYRTGDKGVLGYNDCTCGWKTPYIKELSGRTDDYVLTKEGRKIGRLGHIAKPAKGVMGMQLIQLEPGYLEIKVKPAINFEPASMIEVLKIAKEYLGDMKLSWEITENLEKTNSGKVRYVIRKF
jgi:phenylacetate-CoA ligase